MTDEGILSAATPSSDPAGAGDPLDPETLRALGRNPQGTLAAVRKGRNVIVAIGIDDYPHWPKLKNAVNDAQGVLRVFQSLGFQTLVEPLLNESATRDRILGLVRDDLNEALEEDDSLVLFFAGHGHVETRTVGAKQVSIGYLVPHGGLSSGSGRINSLINLDDFLDAVSVLCARHVLLVLDACFSGVALTEKVDTKRSFESFRDELSSRPSRMVISSTKFDQAASDRGPRRGHSLFTGALVAALEEGAGDLGSKGFITGSELAVYLQSTVAAISGDRDQSPDFGVLDLDQRGQLVISLLGEGQNLKRSREALQGGELVLDLGRRTGDPKRFAAAASLYREALKFANLAKSPMPEAALGLGRALLAAGDAAGAIQALSELAAEGAPPPETHFLLGMAHAAMKEYPAAVAALETWRAASPASTDAGWVEAYIGWLRGAEQSGGRKLALLVGIDHYAASQLFQPLQGCRNDVEKLIGPLLVDRLGFAGGDVVTLVDEEATLERFLAELDRLRVASETEDTLLVYFSGHSVPPSQVENFRDELGNTYLALFDTGSQSSASTPSGASTPSSAGDQGAPGKIMGLPARDLHAALNAVPAARKTLVLDTHASEELTGLAEREAGYALITASDTGEIAYEWRMELKGKSFPCGLLTAALYQSLAEAPDPSAITYREWLASAIEFSQEASRQQPNQPVQTPYLAGIAGEHPFQGLDPGWLAFGPALRGLRPGATRVQVEKGYRLLTASLASGYRPAHRTYGAALHRAGAHRLARLAFQRAAGLEPLPDESSLSSSQAGSLRAVIFLMDPFLPLVDGNEETYEGDHTAALEHLRALLQTKYHVHPEAVEVFTWAEATRDEILRRLTDAASHGDIPCLFVLLNASVSGGPADSLATSSGQMIGLEELRQITAQSPNLMLAIHPEVQARQR